MRDRSYFTILAGAVMFAASGILMLSPDRVQAQSTAEPSLVGQYGDWGVYVNQAQNSKVCFALSQPQQRLPEGLRRGPGYIFISTRPGDNVKNEFSVLVGYPLNEDVDPRIQIGNDTFVLYARGEGGWVRNVAEEPRLIEAIRQGTALVLTSTSARGNETTDRYSLSGSSQALDRVAQECG